MGDFFKTSVFDDKPIVPNQGNSTEDSKTHAHVTLSQVVNLTRKEEGLIMFRQKIHSITVIGVVRNIDEQLTKNVYLIDDYTLGSPVEVKLWKDVDGDNSIGLPSTIKEQTYIRCVGQARWHEDKAFVVAFSVEPIIDPNAISTHMLEAIADSLILEKRLNATLRSTMEPSCSNIEFDQSSTTVESGLNEIQRTVVEVLKKYGSESTFGLERADIKNYMSGVNSNVVDEAIALLVNEGHIFTTTNDDTFKSTEF